MSSVTVSNKSFLDLRQLSKHRGLRPDEGDRHGVLWQGHPEQEAGHGAHICHQDTQEEAPH